MEYFGGATRLLIPDNLKTGVISNTKYDVKLNQSYQELAEHYRTAIVPAKEYVTLRIKVLPRELSSLHQHG